MLFLVGTLLFFPATWCVAATAVIPVEQSQIKTSKQILENGLTLLTTEMPASPVVSIYVLIKTGAATEGEFLGSGISHFNEHMLFKGTEKRKVGDIAGEVQALGGVINASTGFDQTIYTLTLPAEKFAQGLDIMSDMVLHPKFDAAEVEKERQVIIREIHLYNDRPDSFLSQLVFDNAYTLHPYRLPVIGHEELFKQITRDDLIKYYTDHYAPNNMVLSIAGRFDAQKILPQVEATFAGMKRRRDILRNLPREPRQQGLRRYEESYSTELTRMSLAYAGVAAADEDMVPLDILARILGAGDSSRLNRELFTKRQLVYSISASNYTPMDRGIFEIEVQLDYTKVEQVIAAVQEEIQKIVKTGIKPTELAKIKRQVLSEFFRGKQTSDQVADDTAGNESVIGDFNFSKTYVGLINAVTPEDIQRVAGKYLSDRNLSIVILRPKSDESVVKAQQALAAVGEIKKIVLSNGLTILLRENHNFPLVSMYAVLNGGSREEHPDLTGLSEVTAQLWARGTKSKTPEQLGDLVEGKAMGLSGFSGRNSFGISMSMLSSDLEFGMDLLTEILLTPTFPDEELQKGKEKFLAQIMARDDNISQVTNRTLRETLFEKHPFRYEPSGTKESIEKITRADAVNFYQRFFKPENLVLTVFGDFDPVALSRTLEKKLANLPRHAVQIAQFTSPVIKKPAEKAITMDKEQAMVAVGFIAPSLYHQDTYGMEVLSGILGSSFSGRLFTIIRDQLGLAYTLGGRYTPGKDTGMISFQVLTKPETVEDVKAALSRIITDIRDNGVTEKELVDMKAYLKGTFEMGHETDDAMAFMVGLDELYRLGYNHYLSFGEKIDGVTREDVQRLAKQYLDPEKSVTVVCTPKNAGKAAVSPAAPKSK